MKTGEKMIGLRKFILTMSGLAGYVAIMLINNQVDPMNLGLGIGFLITPFAAANAYGKKYQRGEDAGK